MLFFLFTNIIDHIDASAAKQNDKKVKQSTATISLLL